MGGGALPAAAAQRPEMRCRAQRARSRCCCCGSPIAAHIHMYLSPGPTCQYRTCALLLCHKALPVLVSHEEHACLEGLVVSGAMPCTQPPSRDRTVTDKCTTILIHCRDGAAPVQTKLAGALNPAQPLGMRSVRQGDTGQGHLQRLCSDRRGERGGY